MYTLSRDYARLFDLLCTGQVLVGWVRYSESLRDVVKIERRAEFDIYIGVRGICYTDLGTFDREKGEERDVFAARCESVDLEWIEAGLSIAEVDGLRAEITAERQASEREVADGLEFRNHIAALLPESWYTALPVEDRIRLLVEQWRKLHVSHVELTAEVAALRAQFHTRAEQRDFVGKLVDNMPHAQIAAEFEEFKAEVAAANLREEPHAQPCPCAWCRLERDNQGEQ